uniref:Non-structural protein 7b n=1 Tax=Feline coronavirus TaxID=12663 RepID=A0A7G7FE11_9ALPC|nr:accessory protein 7b [Feline coronavirus]QNF22578.1 accessory protein 7b [Feline coronavirus]
MKVVCYLLCFSLVNAFVVRETLQRPVEEHEHPTMVWDDLQHFLKSTLYITANQVLSLPLSSSIDCDVDGFNCSFPGYAKSANDHIDYFFDVSNPFYSFVDSYYISFSDREEKIHVRIVGAMPKEKRLNVGCYLPFSIDLPFGTQIFNDRDLTSPVEGRRLECTYRVYFVRYCPVHANGYCFLDKLKVYNLSQVKSRRAFEKIAQHLKTEL